MSSVVLLLGGNVGDVALTFEGVRADIESRVGAIVSASSVMESEAWGFSAERFKNQALIVETNLSPEALLDATQSIEQAWGRSRECELSEKRESGERYCSRRIDIDIIFYGSEVIRTERLIVPHALLAQREFVLEPLAQIAPELRHAVSGRSVAEMLNDLKRE